MAEEATPSAEPVVISESESISTSIIAEDLIAPKASSAASLSVNIQEESSATVTPEVWQINADGSVTTTDNVTLNTTYKAPQNDKVTVTFTKLSENPGTLTIKQIILSQEDKEDLGAFSDTAYEITSTMQDGTFEYSLTLPIPTNKNIEVKYSEDGQNFTDLSGEKVEQDTVTITGLTHFTIFVVAGTVSGSTATVFNESNASVLINEFVVDPSFAGNEWVELYNSSEENIDLSGWTLEDNSASSISLSGTILAGGFLVFENNSGWLNNPSSNNAGDMVTLKNGTEIVDRVTYIRKTGSTVVTNADDLGVSSIDEGEPIGRTEDGVISGDVWTTYDSPTKGYNNSGDTTFITVGENYGYTSIQNAIDNINEGGTINVTAGSYEETLEIEQSLTLRGAGIGNSTIIDDDCNGDPTINIDADNVTIKNFTIDNDRCGGSVVRIEADRDGIVIQDNELINGYYGIEANGISNSNLTTSDNTITNNDSTGMYLSGGGSSISDSTVTISGNTISSNGGDGIYIGEVEQESTVNITGNTVTNNVQDDGYAGIYVNNVYDSTLTIEDNSEISNNSGLGIYVCAEGECKDSTITISGNHIEDNSSEGISLYRLSSSTLHVENNEILSSGNSGFELEYIGRSEEEINPSTASILGNTIDGNGNYGIYLGESDSQSTITIGVANQGNTISNNSDAGIYLNDNVTGVSITGNTITGNGLDEEEEILFTGIVVNNAQGNQAHRNSISENVVGVRNNDEENAFDARENWWGSSLGPEGDGVDSINGNVLFEPWCLDEDCGHVFFDPPENSLLEDVSYGLPPGATLEDTPSLTFLSEETFTVNHAGGSSTITIPTGVVITRSDNEDFDVSELTSDDVAVSSLAGLGTGVVADGALQWGIPNMGLTFSQPITLSIFVGTALNGQTLDVRRSVDGVTWTNDGIEPPKTCVVTAGLCTFQATKASYFATTHTTPVTTSSSSNSSSSLTAASAPSCTDTKPGSAPTLVSAVGGVNSVTLTWNKALNPVSYYLVTYGSGPSLQQYGNPNVGGPDVTSYTINGLSGGATYYFKVRAGNGCAPGDFSNELSAAPTGGVVSNPAVGFTEGVLGVSADEQSEEKQQVDGGEVKGSSSNDASGSDITEGVINKSLSDTLKNNWIWIIIGLLAIPTVLYLVRRK